MLLVVGQIGKPHGIRGEVSVVVRTDEPEARFTAGSVFITEVPRDRRVSTGPAGAAALGVPFEVPQQLTLESIRWHQGRGIAVFEGIPDRNVAEAMRGVYLKVDSAGMAAPADPDEFHDHQLVGLRVVSADGTELGTVDRIDHAPSSDLIVLKKAGGGTALIPFVTAMVPTVDIAGGRIVVDLPEGLLDL
ncbi:MULTISPECIES: ribosome maturation factor RimM [Actinoplanes]|uniref:Ribosome maturation factor RimM n=2 Tax=Actinoplanes TaxID=1865 RepID=A0A117MPI1_9ACTN|nr:MULTISPECIES: ribosome maturation factor RimM [Actinoplanes]KUL28659.1 16S rRNA processing protein RimM [Actinoplanes awajinensis subsp. mycoplanecinus]GIE65853.1 ribosome maturation factor RimM [Actinoplanes palleronii]